MSNTSTWRPLEKPSSVCVITLVALSALALLLRLSYVRVTKVNAPIRADAQQYVVYAWNVLQHGTFSRSPPGEIPTADSFRSPGYPLFVALALAISGQSFYSTVLYAQSIIGALVVPLTYALGRFFLPRWGALVAAADGNAVWCHRFIIDAHLLLWIPYWKDAVFYLGWIRFRMLLPH